MSLLFNPSSYDPVLLDESSRAKLQSLIRFFEAKGNAEMQSDYNDAVWYQDFLDFQAKEGLFATFGTPSAVGELLAGEDGAATARWDTSRINEFNEILGFYSLGHWYTWQVSVLGLGPVWTSDNDAAKAEVGKLLESGSIFGFGLSEKEHGADIYSTDMILTRSGAGWTASGGKYYIGNGNQAGRVSVFGQFADDDPEYPGEYVFFLADTQSSHYKLLKNVVHAQMYVAAFDLDEYPVSRESILHVGKDAFYAALATVNVGKVNLSWGSIGISEHAFYEAITHANNRELYGMKVTDFPHVRRLIADAYARLVAMKIFAARSADYFRESSPDDRRFLLFNPIMKAKVTSEGQDVVDLLWDVVAAKGFEKDTYFSQAAVDIRALPKLEGTVHVNIALVLKFMPAYLGAAHGAAQEYPSAPVRQDATDDGYLFRQGPARGLGKIRFPDWRPSFERFAHLPNVATFRKQIEAFTALVMSAPPSEEQQKDLDYLQVLGQLFTQIVYAQLICESAGIALDGGPEDKRVGSVSDLTDLTEAHIDRIFAVFVQDFSEFAVALHGQASASEAQREGSLKLISAPSIAEDAEEAFVSEVLSYDGAYVMAE
jgi:acyl-CoA dehydrogenase